MKWFEDAVFACMVVLFNVQYLLCYGCLYWCIIVNKIGTGGGGGGGGGGQGF